jgi:hypothetical protein
MIDGVAPVRHRFPKEIKVLDKDAIARPMKHEPVQSEEDKNIKWKLEY